MSAADWAYPAPDQPALSYVADFGLRFWYGRSNTSKSLYDPSGSFLVSRLTYGDLSIFAAEVYGRVDLDRRWFVKGYVGGGAFRGGSLKDEDFPPALTPYSATLSTQQNSTPIYASVDVGFNVLFGPDFRVGLFAGFHYLNETTSVYGCGQIAFNPNICGVGPVPNTVKVISQYNNWYSARLGVNAEVDVDRFRFSVDAAWLPYVSLNGWDAHWLRISGNPGDFTSAVPEDGTGWGFQLDAFVSYRVTDMFSVGIGGRYWYMQTKGLTHFEDHVVGGGALPQPVDWKVQNFGVFLQASLKLGPYAAY